MFLPAVGIGNLAEKQPGVLGLEDDELVEPGIGFGRCGHVARVRAAEEIYKWEDGERRAFRPPRGRCGPDALGGLRSITASDPEWAFTADMSIHLLPAGPIEVLQADLHVRRRGRRTLVIEAELLADGERPAGSALLTFAVVPRPEHLVNITIDMTPGRRMMNRNSEHEPLTTDYLDELQLLVTQPGSATIELHPAVCNTVGALHGAVHASLVDEASASLARSLLGRDVVTTDMHLAYLELGRVGPLSATATSVGGPSSDRVSTVVEIRDGNGMLVSYATAEVCGL